MKFKAQRLQLFDLEAEKHSYLTLWVFSKWNEYHCGKSWTCLLFWLKKTLEIPQWGGNIYLFVPLQQDRAAVLWRPLEAFVDVFHQQVHAVFVERLNAFLDVTALEGAEHLQHQTLRTVLARREQTAEGQSRYTFQSVRIPGCEIIDHWTLSRTHPERTSAIRCWRSATFCCIV